MMIKYRVHDVAKDLDVPNKEVLDILGKYVKEPKKHKSNLLCRSIFPLDYQFAS